LFEAFKSFKLAVEKSKGCQIRIFQSDNGGEYVNKYFNDLFNESGIFHRKTVPYSPEQNGISERYNRTLFNAVRCMLVDSGVPSNFWGEAVGTACFVLNRCPSSAIKIQIPWELWYGESLSQGR